MNRHLHQSPVKLGVRSDGSILLIGDSIIRNINPRKLSRRKVNKLNVRFLESLPRRSYLGSEEHQVWSIIRYFACWQSVCVEKIKNLAININKKFSKSTVGLSSITTRRDLNLEEQIAKVNFGLQEFCTKNKFNFIDNRNLDSYI